MLERKVQKIILDEGLGAQAHIFLESIAVLEQQGWGTNDPDLLEVVNKCYAPQGLVEVQKAYDDQLDPPEFYVLKLTPLGYAVNDALSGKKFQR